MLFLGRFTLREAPGFWGFLQHLQPNISEEQKSLTIYARGTSTVLFGKFGPGYCITFIKRLDEGLR